MHFSGSFVALITPFTSDGEIDYPAFEELVRWHIDAKTDGIVCCGTTGECPTLSEPEKINLLRRCVNISKGQVPIILNSGSNDTRQSVLLTQKAKDLGADGALVVVPYYNRPTMLGCTLHFQEVDKVGLPLILYHHPKRTGTKLNLETVQEIAKLPTIVAIKEASGELSFAQKLKETCEIDILSGDDEKTFDLMKMRCSGTISIVGNIIPQEYRNYIRAFLDRDTQKAEEYFYQYKSLIQTLSLEVNPQCVKYGLSLMGKCRPCFRLPLIEPQLETKKQIELALSQMQIIKPTQSLTESV